MADVKTATAKSGSHANRAGKPKNANYTLINLIIVVACIALAEGIFHGIFGQADNFKDAEKHVPANFAGTMYSGGMGCTDPYGDSADPALFCCGACPYHHAS